MKPTAFRALARTFDTLERTSSSTAMVEALARFLQTLSPQEARRTAYLLSGRLGPSYAAPVFGIADATLTRAIAEAFDVPAARVARLTVRTGDLGAAAQALDTRRGAALSIGEVFAELQRVAKASGAGSQQRKREALAHLLRRTSGAEAKYVVRTVAGTHRVGAAEMTFLRALASASGDGAASKAVLESAYDVLSDLGEVAYRALHDGARSLAHARPKLGIPVRMMLASRVERLSEVARHLHGERFVEYKYDGERVQIHLSARGVPRAFSRRMDEITHQYPELLERVRRQLHAKNAIVEGEVVAVDPKSGRLLPFQVVMQRKRKRDVAAYRTGVPVALFLFDLLYLDGKSLLRTPLAERKRLLAARLRNGARVKLGDFIRTEQTRETERYFRAVVKRGAEGVVIKGAHTLYEAGHRGWSWIKFKKAYAAELADTFDLVVVGALHGKGSRAGTYGSLLAAAFDPRTNRYASLTKVGTGFSDEMLRRLPALLKRYRIPAKHHLVETDVKMDVWFEPRAVIEVSGAELTVSPVHAVARSRLSRGGLALRFPRFVRFRDDKSPEQATTVAEIWRLYRS